jgi:hypothetical protein
MTRDLIDPMNTDTYDDRVIMHGPIRSQLPNDAYRRGWDKAFGKLINIKIRRRSLWLKNLHVHFWTESTTNFIKELKQC